MIHQFFPASAVEFRQLVLKATSEAPHELWAVGSPENPIAAVMISSSPGTLGLYNLCIRSQDRSKGLGTQILRFMQHRAFLENRVLVLQCDLNLETWYRPRKFKKIGVMSSFYLRK
jgi:ribosomal protein S18 acetylase RimI-like enzyme